MSTQANNGYLLLFRNTNWHKGLSPEQIQNVMTQWKSWFDGLTQQGKIKGGEPLGPEGKVVSGKNGRVIADGPFAESKEAIAGYFLVNAKSLDEAVAIAKNCPGLEYGSSVEVRAIAEHGSCSEKTQAAELAHA